MQDAQFAEILCLLLSIRAVFAFMHRHLHTVAGFVLLRLSLLLLHKMHLNPFVPDLIPQHSDKPQHCGDVLQHMGATGRRALTSVIPFPDESGAMCFVLNVGVPILFTFTNGKGEPTAGGSGNAP